MDLTSFWRWLSQLLRLQPTSPASSNNKPSQTRPATKVAGTVVGGVAVASIAAYQFVFTSGWEGVKFKPYQDVVGVWTVCIGHTGPDIIKDKTYTKAECEALFAQDMATKVDAPLSVCLRPPKPLSEKTVVAIRDFTFNVGGKAACGSTMMKKLNAGDTAGACEEFRRWTKAGGQVWRGLVLRRIGGDGRLSETDLCKADL